MLKKIASVLCLGTFTVACSGGGLPSASDIETASNMSEVRNVNCRAGTAPNTARCTWTSTYRGNTIDSGPYCFVRSSSNGRWRSTLDRDCQ